MNVEERTRYIEQRKEATHRQARLWCKDERRDFDVWRVEVDALVLNVDNRRFAAERKLMEEQLGHSLDPENSRDDELSVISILLDTGLHADGSRVVGTASKDYEALRSDWLRRRQETPLWIRPDGTVRNGNRRVAMLKRLREQEGQNGVEWVEAIILDPTDIDEDDLFKMEQREQLTDDFKVKYTDINLLLTLRDAAIAEQIDWADSESIELVAGALQQIAGGDRAYAAIQLRAIRAMDAFLDDSNVPGEYQRLFGMVERFREVGKIMARIEEDYQNDAPDMLRLLFAAVRAGNTHNDLRAIRKIFLQDKTLYGDILKVVADEESEWDSSAEHALDSPDIQRGSSDDDEPNDDDEPAPIIPAVPNYPSANVKTIIKDRIDAYQASSNRNIKSSLFQAVSRLDAVPVDQLAIVIAGSSGIAERDLVERIVAWADDARKHLE